VAVTRRSSKDVKSRPQRDGVSGVRKFGVRKKTYEGKTGRRWREKLKARRGTVECASVKSQG